jgi:carboxylesterase type B
MASQLSQQDITSIEDLRKLSFETLYNINAMVVGTAPYSNFIFGPTIDGTFDPDLPSRLLSHEKHNNSLNVLIGYNAQEGISFAPPSVQTEARFASYVQRLLPGAGSSIVNHVTAVLCPPVFNGSYGYTDFIGRSAALTAESMITCNAASIAPRMP